LIEGEKFPEDLKEKDIELNVASATRAHMQNFLQAIDEKKRPIADIEQGHISTASCIMANLSMKWQAITIHRRRLVSIRKQWLCLNEIIGGLKHPWGDFFT
jgi:hypothetical protein